MNRFLYLAQADKDNKLSQISLEALTAAKQLADSVSASLAIGLVGENIQELAASLSDASSEIAIVDGPEFSSSRYATDAAALEALVKQTAPSVVVAPATFRMNRVLPGVAHRAGGHIDTHVNGFTAENKELVVTRWYYRQRLLAEQTQSKEPWFLTIDAGLYSAFVPGPGKATVKIIDVDVDQKWLRTTVKEFKSPAGAANTVKPDADLLFVSGAGWTKRQQDGTTHVDDATEIITGFLQKTGASLGSTKSLVDLSGEGQQALPFLTNLNQVGQTGSTPRHPKGLATACHGEEPHAVGWRFIKERRAINLDPNCGWAQGKADVLYIADAFKVMKKVNELLD